MARQNRIWSIAQQFLWPPACRLCLRGKRARRGEVSNSPRLRLLRENARGRLRLFCPRRESPAQKASAKAGKFARVRSIGSLWWHFSPRRRADFLRCRDSTWQVALLSVRTDRAARARGRAQPVCRRRFRRHFQYRVRCARRKIPIGGWLGLDNECSRTARLRIRDRGELLRRKLDISRECVSENRTAWRCAAVSISRLRRRPE